MASIGILPRLVAYCLWIQLEAFDADLGRNTRAVISDFHGTELYFFCFSPCGDRIAMFYGKTIQLWDVRQGKLIAKLTWAQKIDDQCEIAFFKDGSGIQITQPDLINLDIIPSSHQSAAHDDDDSAEHSVNEDDTPKSNRSLPFEFVTSSMEKPLLFLKYRDHASYRVASVLGWVLDTKNRRMCLVHPDQRPSYSESWDAHGTKVAWCGVKGLVFLDFAHISTDDDNDFDNTD
jgi:hypothetical protein